MLAKDVSAVGSLTLVPSHSLGGLERRDPKFVVKAMRPGTSPDDVGARPVVLRVDLGERVTVMQRKKGDSKSKPGDGKAAADDKNADMDPSWRAPLNDRTRAFFDRHNKLVIETLTTVKGGKVWGQVRTVITPRPEAYTAARM